MSKEIIFLVEEDQEGGGYTAKALGHSIFTEGKDMDDLKTMIQDAVRTHFGNAKKPPIIRLHIVKEEVIPA